MALNLKNIKRNGNREHLELQKGIMSALVSKSFLFLFLYFLGPPSSLAVSQGECVLEQLSLELLQIFLWFSEGSQGKYWNVIAWGKTLCCLKPLNASQTDLGADALPDPIFKQLGLWSYASPAVSHKHRAWKGSGEHVCKHMTFGGKNKKLDAMFPCFLAKG